MRPWIRWNKRRLLAVLGLALLPALPLAAAEGDGDRLELEDIEIRGMEGLPKVIYIVPWNEVPHDSGPLTLKSRIDEELAPVDIEVFRRQLQYRDAGGR